jgi:hypothetical protein
LLSGASLLKGREIKTFDAHEWVAAMCLHVSTGASRWCGTMAITAMFSVAIGKRKKLIFRYPALLNADPASSSSSTKKRVHSGIPYLSLEEFEVIVQDELERLRLGQIALKFHD